MKCEKCGHDLIEHSCAGCEFVWQELQGIVFKLIKCRCIIKGDC